MNISSVNKIFLKIAEVQLRWRWLILGAIILFTAFCFSGLPKLKMANNEEEWFEDWEQVKIDSDRWWQRWPALEAYLA